MKTCEEWSLEFDQMYNNITSDKAPGLNEFEKSKFLTRAQERVVMALYNGSLGAAFESTEAVTHYLAALVSQTECNKVTSGDPVKKLWETSEVYVLPEDLLFITSEFCKVTEGSCANMDAVVVPVTQDELWRTVRNPFKGPNGNRVLRLLYSSIPQQSYTYSTGSGSGSGSAVVVTSGSGSAEPEYSVVKFSELIPKKNTSISKYIVRYISRPKPIILVNLSGGLTIDGQTAARPCMLDEALHPTILSEAVRMAKEAWTA